MTVTDRPPLDWQDMQDILVLAEEGSLSAAARRLGLSQSTMSRRLAAIEDKGIAAFTRDAAGRLVATETGDRLLAAATRMRASFEEAVAQFGGAAPLRVASCEVTARLFLADALPEWATRAGSAPVDHAVYDDLFSLGDNAFDVLITPPEGRAGLSLGQIEWGVFQAAGRATRLSPGPRPLEGCPVIAPSGSLARIAAYDWLMGLGGRPVLMASSPLAQQEACARGTGVAMLPVGLAAGDARLEPLGIAGPPVSTVWMIVRREAAETPRVAPFLRWARRRFAPQPR